MLVEIFEKFLHELEDGLSKNAIKAIEASVSKSANDIGQIIYNNVIRQSIDEYYSEYEPSIYHRTFGLYDALDISIKSDKTGFEIECVKLPDRMSQHYSRSPRHQSGDKWISRFENDEFDPDGEDNGLPENEWIFNNFWNGIHPKIGIVGGHYFNDSIAFSTFKDKAQRRFEEVTPQISQILLFNVVKEFSKYF